MGVWIVTEMPNWGEPENDYAGLIRGVYGSQHSAMDRLEELERDQEDDVFIAQAWEVQP